METSAGCDNPRAAGAKAQLLAAGSTSHPTVVDKLGSFLSRDIAPGTCNLEPGPPIK
jgi:hypothetical protein